MARQPEVLGHAFNFSTEIQVTVLDMVRRILRLMGSTLEPDVRGEAHATRSSTSTCPRRRPGACSAWSPRYALDDGLARDHRLVSRIFLAAGANARRFGARAA